MATLIAQANLDTRSNDFNIPATNDFVSASATEIIFSNGDITYVLSGNFSGTIGSLAGMATSVDANRFGEDYFVASNFSFNAAIFNDPLVLKDLFNLDDQISSTSAADYIQAGAGNDTITALGNDTIVGEAGLDTIVIDGLRSAYEITYGGAINTIAGAAGTITALNSTELVQFNDGTVDLRNGPNSTSTELYRFYNTTNGTHFYTSSAAERDSIVANNELLTFEGNAFGSNASADNGGAAVYRFFNFANNAHFYTANAEEAAGLRQNAGFRDEGTAFYAYSSENGTNTALYRFFNTETGSHFYTTNAAERANIINTLGHYVDEGIAYYVDIA